MERGTWWRRSRHGFVHDQNDKPPLSNPSCHKNQRTTWSFRVFERSFTFLRAGTTENQQPVDQLSYDFP